MYTLVRHERVRGYGTNNTDRRPLRNDKIIARRNRIYGNATHEIPAVEPYARGTAELKIENVFPTGRRPDMPACLPGGVRALQSAGPAFAGAHG